MGIKSNCPTFYQALLLFWIIAAFIFIKLDRNSYFNDNDETEHGIGKSDSEKIKKLYHAAETLSEEYEGLEVITNQLKILSTREFSTEARPLTCDGCNKFDYPTLINPKDLCGGVKPIDILIQTTTIPKSKAERNVIRRTWASWTWNNTNNVRHMFLFGSGWNEEEQRIIQRESDEHGDVLQQGYKDSYYNLSYKVVMGYKWALDHCQRAKFILRTAEDNFINIPALVHYLRKNSHMLQRTQLGCVRGTMPAIRSIKSKFYVPFHEYPYETYPPYAIGSSFVYSMSAIREFMAAAPNVPFFALEDVWFGFVMEQIKMDVRHDKGFDVILNEEALHQAMAEGQCPGHGSFYTIHLMAVSRELDSLLASASIQVMEGLWAACHTPVTPFRTTLRP